MKRSNKAISGLIAGAAIGVLTFVFVKPKFNKKKAPKNQEEKVISIKKDNPDDLFI